MAQQDTMREEKRSILIVDDDAHIRDSLGRALKVEGFDVEEAGTGSEAIASCGAKFFHLVLIDMRLPDISGLEVLKAVIALNQDIIAIMMTGYASLDTSIEAMNRGAYSYVVKPIDVGGLLVLMENGLKKQRMSLENKRMVETLRASEQKFKTVFNEAIDGMLIASAESQEFLEANDSICRMLGYTQEEIRRLGVEDIHPQEDLPSVRKLFERQMKREIAIGKDIRLKRKNGDIFYADIGSSPIDLFGRKCLLGIFRDVSDYKRAEDELEKAEKYNRKLVEGANSIILRWKTTGPITFINDFGLKKFGYTREELIGADVSILVPGQESTGRDLSNLVSNILIDPEKYSLVENENIKKDGGRFWAIWTNKALTDEHGNTQEILAIGNDITDQKRIEEDLLNSKTQLWELFNNMNSCVAVYEAKDNGRDFVFVDINRAGENSSKVSRADVIGKSVLQVFPSVKEIGLFEVFQQVWKTGQAQHHPLSLYKDERILQWVENYVFKLPSGEVVAIYNDVTESKRAETALAEEAVRRRILIEQSRDGIVILDRNGKVYEANKRFTEMLGYSPGEVRELNVWDWEVEFPKEQVMEMIRSVDEKGDFFETRHRRKDGTFFDVEISTNGAQINGEGLIFCVCRDITERKRAGQEKARQLNELQRWQDVMLDREDRILELKKEVNGLLAGAGQAPRYPSAEKENNA